MQHYDHVDFFDNNINVYYRGSVPWRLRSMDRCRTQ